MQILEVLYNLGIYAYLYEYMYDAIKNTGQN